MTPETFLHIVQDIHAGVGNQDTMHPSWQPLWQYPLVSDALQRLLEDVVRGDDPRNSRDELRIVCDIFCQGFFDTATRELDIVRVG